MTEVGLRVHVAEIQAGSSSRVVINGRLMPTNAKANWLGCWPYSDLFLGHHVFTTTQVLPKHAAVSNRAKGHSGKFPKKGPKSNNAIQSFSKVSQNENKKGR